MTSRIYASVVLFAMALSATGCANTIRGAGKDVANTVHATQNAGHRIARAAK